MRYQVHSCRRVHPHPRSALRQVLPGLSVGHWYRHPGQRAGGDLRAVPTTESVRPYRAGARTLHLEVDRRGTRRKHLGREQGRRRYDGPFHVARRTTEFLTGHRRRPASPCLRSADVLLRPGGRTVDVDDRLARLGWNHRTQIRLARCLMTAVAGLQRLAVRRQERG